MDKRYGRVKWGPAGTRMRTSHANWRKPLAWNRQAAADGKRARVFCASLADVFEDKPDQPELNDWRSDLMLLIQQTPQLDWLLLTKRPKNVMRLFSLAWQKIGGDPVTALPNNIWIGTSVENQAAADERIPELLKIPAAVRFLSCEPLLGPINLENLAYEAAGPAWAGYNKLIDWVIVGGESGPNARPMHPRWARSLRNQCQEAGVSYFFKQHGEWIGMPDLDPFTHGMSHPHQMIWEHEENDPDDLPISVYRVGKKAAGRLLDGREWNELPKLANAMNSTEGQEL